MTTFKKDDAKKSAVRVLAAMGLWPGPRDPASEAAVTEPNEHELERVDRDMGAPWMAIGRIVARSWR